MIVKNHNEGEKDYNICSYTCSQRFTTYYGNGYWNDILNKEEVSWKTKYPNVAEKMFELERRIEKLENK